MWQPILRKLLWRAVTSKAGSTAKSSGNARSVRCDIGLVFALPQESGCFVDRLSGVVTTHGAGFVAKSGQLGDKQIVVIISGAGHEAAYRATDALITAHHPRWVISTGFAGGLHESLKRGDFLFADEVVSSQGRTLTIDLKLDSSALGKIRAVHTGRIATTDKLMFTPAQKRALHAESGALAVDLETLAVAEACRAAATPLVSIRVISDAVDETLPRDIARLIAKPSRVRQVGYAFGTLLRRPSSAKDLLRLKETALVLSERLAKLLTGVIEQLPESSS
jgi:adenosylhomocysteine nucleosidase